MIRNKCVGNCGREVLIKLGAECRKCRKARLHAGLKRIKKLKRSEAQAPVIPVKTKPKRNKKEVSK